MKKVKTLMVAMIFVFAALGGAYALWYDSLFINETVKTGVIDLIWCAAPCTKSDDPGPNYEGYNGDVYSGSTDINSHYAVDDPDYKNIGYLDLIKPMGNDSDLETLPPIEGTWRPRGIPASYDTPSGSYTRYTGDKMTLVLGNGYPGYSAGVTTQIINLGTIPVKLHVGLAPDSKPIPKWLHLQIYKKTGSTLADLLWDSWDPDNGLIQGWQLDLKWGATDRLMVYIKETIETEDGSEVPENATADFTLQVKGVQWNEYGYSIP